ncbi:hypothetical protein L218DRAFT_376830 [Marasmius fiardii PR-910]|nr:hypothetical protein L218DRAFT_376830 [Marasmius fiardii PR-910]
MEWGWNESLQICFAGCQGPQSTFIPWITNHFGCVGYLGYVVGFGRDSGDMRFDDIGADTLGGSEGLQYYIACVGRCSVFTNDSAIRGQVEVSERCFPRFTQLQGCHPSVVTLIIADISIWLLSMTVVLILICTIVCTLQPFDHEVCSLCVTVGGAAGWALWNPTMTFGFGDFCHRRSKNGFLAKVWLKSQQRFSPQPRPEYGTTYTCSSAANSHGDLDSGGPANMRQHSTVRC